MTSAKMKDVLKNHNYLNLNNKIIYEMLTFKREFEEDLFLEIVNDLRSNIGEARIDYQMPMKRQRSKEEIMNDVLELKWITSKPSSWLPLHQYLVKNKNCKQELYYELYSLIFYEYDRIEYSFSNYYKVFFWEGRKYWIMNSDYRHSIIINRDFGDKAPQNMTK
ncbi:hypothetical protein CQA63_04470 [Helicobacter marmotae]|uniref:Uncharacterized protein n=2 Tax=Helicobacter marmotae TaxID=152490 RepID=A0A3D8I4C9_9HELI|nr:hypothetical protein CQA63_04470 [Helicobacter marmotae]